MRPYYAVRQKNIQYVTIQSMWNAVSHKHQDVQMSITYGRAQH